MKDKKRQIILGFFYLFLSAGLIFLLLKFGVKIAVDISYFLQKRSHPQDFSDSSFNILAEPQLLPFPEATNSANLKVIGYAPSNQKVDIYLNNFNVKTFEVDSEGKFEGFVSLALGINKIYAVTVDVNGNKSSPSKEWEIFYNNSPPYLEILEPENHSTFKKSQNQVTIKGKVASTSKVFINGQRLITEFDGTFNNFSYQVTLQKGENKFTITCLDPALNKTEVEWILNYQP